MDTQHFLSDVTIKTNASEVFKLLHNLFLSFINDMFEVKYVPYDLRHSNILCRLSLTKLHM